jgi:hypothetical protein
VILWNNVVMNALPLVAIVMQPKSLIKCSMGNAAKLNPERRHVCKL